MRSLCLFRRIHQLTADQKIRPAVQECLEAAICRADHLDPVGFLKSLLPFCGVAERLRAVSSDSLELSLGEDPLGGDGGPGGPWTSSEEDMSVAVGLSSSDDVGLDPEAESSEDE